MKTRWVSLLTVGLPVLLVINTNAAIRYVDVNSPGPAQPYTNWATAARTIQDAVDAADAGDTILVATGLYQIGGRAVIGSLTNRVAVTKAVTVQSVNGPAATIIQGNKGPYCPSICHANVRCVYLTNGAVLAGFTLTKGATAYTDTSNPAVPTLDYGGGVWCESASAVVSNCVIRDNWAWRSGGGAKDGTLIGCTLISNTAYYAYYSTGGEGGGAYGSRLSNCVLTGNTALYGGGVSAGILNNCTLTQNRGASLGYYGYGGGGGTYNSTLKECILSGNSGSYGGGAYYSRLTNCIVTGNSADLYGGGAFSSSGPVKNCLIAGNSALYGGGAHSSSLDNCTLIGNFAQGGGGLYNPSYGYYDDPTYTVNNCILYYNTALTNDNYYTTYRTTFNFCCTTPPPFPGVSNLVAEPLLADSVHLSAESPCRGAGRTNSTTGLDIDGEPWGNPPSIGCDDYYSGSATGALSVAVRASLATTSPGYAVNFTAQITGHASASRWEFDDLTVVSNRPVASRTWSVPGDYPVVLRVFNDSNPSGVTATLTVHVVEAPVHYVAASSANPVAPYTSWATPARRIQDAVDAASVPGAIVLVTNGVYTAVGPRPVGPVVTVLKPLTVRSVNGASVTVIDGFNMVSCAYLTNLTRLEGFTLTRGGQGGLACFSTNAFVSSCVIVSNIGSGVSYGTLSNCIVAGNGGASFGGGAYYSVLKNCTISGNTAFSYGGGAYRSTIESSTVMGNSAYSGGGAYNCTLRSCQLSDNHSETDGGGSVGGTLNHCTLIGNSTSGYGGGSSGGTLTNCILFYNRSSTGSDNYWGNALNYCCTTPLPDSGTGNITAEPQLADAAHLSAGSPCRGAGSSALSNGTDIDGEPWANPPSIGCDEYGGGPIDGPLSLAVEADYTNVAVGFVVNFTARIAGHASVSRWEFDDGTVVSNRLYASHSWAAAGDFPVVLRAFNESNPSGVSASISVHVVTAPVHYVALESTNPVVPYASWETAATDIQQALSAASVPGAVVLVGDGVYRTGATLVSHTDGLSRVVVSKPVTVQSLHGPSATVIEGQSYPYRVRCVYLAHGARLTGFTLTNGQAWQSSSGASGGGVRCESTAVVSNCVLVGNDASQNGGGASGGTLENCTLTNNSASYNGGGANGSRLANCNLTGNRAQSGGGAAASSLTGCLVSSNSAAANGGGASACTLNSCVLVGNNSDFGGGGASGGTLNNCTITGNQAYQGGGADYCNLNNCILFYNHAVDDGDNYSGGTLNFCCTTPLPASGSNNINVEPLLADFAHLSASSPCRGAGSSAYANDVDIDGESWSTSPSIGCDEYRAGSITGPLTLAIQADYTNAAARFAVNFTGRITGHAAASRWDFGDGTIVSNTPYVSHSWSTGGTYDVVLRAYNETYPAGVSATATVHIAESPIHYVSMLSTNPVPPYRSWATAATNIQDAATVAWVGSTILVAKGVYGPVSLTNPLNVQSVNGPIDTAIAGGAYLRGKITLSGFTLTRGSPGVFCQSTEAVVTNCFITGNYGYQGGGAYGGTLRNCTLATNTAAYGGGACQSTLYNCALNYNTAYGCGEDLCHSVGGGALQCVLNNCTLTGNSADEAGGASDSTLNNCGLTRNSALYGSVVVACTLNNCTLTTNGFPDYYYYYSAAIESRLNNCILYYNYGGYGDENYSGCVLNYCCTTPLPDSGIGNFTNAPQLTYAFHLTPGSPCRGAGSAAYASGVDIDGDAWANPPSVGCDEYQPASLRVAIQAAYVKVPANFAVDFMAQINGYASSFNWDFGDGTIVSNQLTVSHSWTSPGNYPVVLRAFNESYPTGQTATVIVAVLANPIHYVTPTSANPVAPYTSWATAARTIQDAVEAAYVGSTILVSNGVYDTGIQIANWSMAGRVAVTRPLNLRSVNGPSSTVISGNGLMRCVYLADGAMLSGFTLTNGAAVESGGGVYCETPSVVVSNCVIAGNSAAESGGGVYQGVVNRCQLIANHAGNGGGAGYSVLNNCTLRVNSGYYGGGVYNSSLANCALTGNSASIGGGASGSYLNNCTLTGNSAVERGGGAYLGTLNNCILYYNTAEKAPNYSGSPYSPWYSYPIALNYCCTTPLPDNGTNNITAEPELADGFHLNALSPCRGAGSAAFASGTDIDGETWGDPPAIGCDEFRAGAITGSLSVAIAADYTNFAAGFTVNFTAQIDGHAGASRWEFGDGTVVSNRPFASHAWATAGDFQVVLRAFNESHPAGVSATFTVHVAQAIHYVSLSSTNPVAPYSSWATAATNIQDAADAALIPGALVLVSNGVYQTGSRMGPYGDMNRLTVTNIVNLASVNGPDVTTISGGDTMRSVFLRNGAQMIGFTLSHGNTHGEGGGVACESTLAVLSNCTLTANSANRGGGAYQGTLNNCRLMGNTGTNAAGGAHQSTLNHCIVIDNSAPGTRDYYPYYYYPNGAGGGVLQCTLSDCVLAGNSAGYGGGVLESTLDNCTLTNNTAYSGAGAYQSLLNQCVLNGNRVTYYGYSDYFEYYGGSGGGAYDSSLNRCTLQGNSAYYGGGTYYGTLKNCTLSGNTAAYISGNNVYGNFREFGGYGGGAYYASLNNCGLTGNSAYQAGGGASGGTLNNCTLTGNSARSGGGVSSDSYNNNTTLNNCLLYYNDAPTAPNYSGGTLNYCCTAPLPAVGTRNIDSDPQLTDAFHLGPDSPCLGAGSAAFASGVDIDGEAFAVPPPIGCDQYHPGPVTGPLSVAIRADYLNVAAGFTVNFTATIGGHAGANRWDFGDGTVLSNRLGTAHAWNAAGDYPVLFRAYNDSYPSGVSATLMIHVTSIPVHYVALSNANPVAPYTNWATAARTIQDAVDAATIPGALVLVTNGVYSAGGRTASGSLMSRVAVIKPITVRSINGPAQTSIQGYQAPGATNGLGAVRCVYLTNRAALIGFTLTGGATLSSGDYRDQTGGGVRCEAASAVISNCVLTGNSAFNSGGGALGGTLYQCAFTNNVANYGGGAAGSALNDCILAANSAYYGGGVSGSGAVLNRCLLIANSGQYGGGVYYGLLNNCVLSANSAFSGGGVSQGTLNNCALTGNSATYGGGAGGSVLNNCIAFYNAATNGPNYYYSTLDHCCTTPDFPGFGNITNAPNFVSLTNGNLRLQAGSPCINAGNNDYVVGPADLDGQPRIVGDSVDIGAFEYLGPVIVLHPQNQFILAGHDAIFTARATGILPLSYQWWFNGTNAIAGATASSLKVSHVQSAGAGLYSVSVSNSYGLAMSSNALLQVDYALVAVARVFPLFRISSSDTNHFIISPDNTSATVIYDGSLSTDPENDPLQFAWFLDGETNAFATGVVATNTLAVGGHAAVLAVSDGPGTATDRAIFEVITAADAVNQLQSWLLSALLPPGNRRPLLATLQAAAASFSRGQMRSGVNQLGAFQNQVRAQVQPLSPAVGEVLTSAAQQILNAVHAGNSSSDDLAKPIAAKVKWLARQANGKMQLRFSGEAGTAYLIQASTNLVDWETVGIATDHGDGSFELEDAKSGRMPYRFYRVVQP